MYNQMRVRAHPEGNQAINSVNIDEHQGKQHDKHFWDRKALRRSFPTCEHFLNTSGLEAHAYSRVRDLVRSDCVPFTAVAASKKEHADEQRVRAYRERPSGPFGLRSWQNLQQQH